MSDPIRGPAMLGALVVLVAGCGDLLTVEDPQRYTSDDLDEAPEAVANGVEGDFHTAIDTWVIYTNLLSDQWRHTGTWAGYEEFDAGTMHYGNSGGSNSAMNTLLRTRWAAQNAADRFDRALEGEAGQSPLTAQVRTVEAWTTLLLGQSWCEAPAEPGGPAVSDVRILESAVEKLEAALSVAEAAGADRWIRANRAGLARANLLLGNNDRAFDHAQQVPDGFVYEAHFSDNTGRQYNSIVSLNTTGFNRAAGMREKWWPMVDSDAGLLRDPWTDELDPRVPIRYDGELGVNGFTPHFSQFKYTTRGSNIPVTHADEMRLIEAEVHWRRNEHDEALATLNGLRSAVGLSALPETDDPEQVMEFLLHERFAELFMEGQRMSDLQRFDRVADMTVVREEQPDQDLFTSDRPVKFPLSQQEALHNQEIQDDASMRCLPTAG